ncbi:hypothetical protein N7533_011217 [Penicillium manginii]|uniref:uncharacterized protein n=1 Tax=Penicillium manginii TaxID=203109 RepID=UPI002548F1D1|nr:uncharacterized protein N7533_011217 [Penicillium manginii]KAJ5741808.1 hypothetical protein N7533_011217 [Penicillium manginii]
MEIAGLVVSVASLVGLFETCSKLYDRVSSAKAYLEDSADLGALLEIEKGRFAELRHEIEGIVNPSGADSPMTNNNQLIETTANNELEIEIEGDSRIQFIGKILRLVERRLVEAERLISKYDAEPGTASQSTSGSRAKLFGFVSKKLRPVRWATGDKTALDNLVEKLRRLNKGLERQLPQPLLPRLRLGFATSQILPADPQKLQSIENASLQAGYGILSKGAAVRLACLSQEMVVPHQTSVDVDLMNFMNIGIDNNAKGLGPRLSYPTLRCRDFFHT